MNKRPTPETDAFFFRTDIDWDMEVDFARRLERDRDEQCRLLGMSAERECDLRGKVERLERERDELKQQIKQVREQYRLSSVCRELKAENEKLKQQQQ